MAGPGEPSAEQAALIVGRDAALARLRGLVDPAPPASRVPLVLGEAGMGKTALLADAADRAQLAGMRVLWFTGRESESRLAFAGLHQLLRPVLSSAAGLPRRLAQALLGALAVLASRFAALSEQTQAALLLAAVADGPDLNAAASRGAGPDARDLAPAEQLGLVKIGRTGVQYTTNPGGGRHHGQLRQPKYWPLPDHWIFSERIVVRPRSPHLAIRRPCHG